MLIFNQTFPFGLKMHIFIIRLFRIVIFQLKLPISVFSPEILFVFLSIFPIIIFSLTSGRQSLGRTLFIFDYSKKIEKICNSRRNAGEIWCVRGWNFCPPEGLVSPKGCDVRKPRYFPTNCLNFHRKIFSQSRTIEKKLTAD